MSEEQDEKERGFKIDDRRRFTSEGEAREESLGGEPSTGDAGAKGDPDLDAEFQDEELLREGAPEDLTFSSFVIGLASQAFAFLGAVPDPQSGVVRKDLPQAKALIDILSMLKDKTAGNLDEHEARMMEEMLYELRIHYVKELRAVASHGGKS
jgi:hypothetical protein